MNILTFDIEEWYIEKKFHGGRKERYEVFDSHLDRILDILDAQNLKATFFCVGKIAEEFPGVIRRITKKGHEIGCHSNEHLWLTQMTPEELRKDTREALSALQDVSGQEVLSYRAPAFSIGESNRWAIEVLAECGIERDASIFPAVRDFGGFSSFSADAPVIVESGGCRLKEFPIGLTRVLGKEMAYSGGGYFRFFPLFYVKNKIRRGGYAIVYFHIGDLIHKEGGMMSRKAYENYFKENGSFVNRFKRYVKSNLGTKNAFSKMERLLETVPFVNVREASESILWDKIRIIAIN